MTNKHTHDAPAALWWPDNLEFIHMYNLDCYLDYDAPDPATGYAGNAWLVHAYAGGVDVRELLREDVVRDIEQRSVQLFSEARQCLPF